MPAHLTVRPGDTWVSLCQAFGKTPSALGELLTENPSLAPPKPMGVGSVPLPRLVPGTRLRLPASFTPESAKSPKPVFLGDPASAADAAYTDAVNAGTATDNAEARARFVPAVASVVTAYCQENRGLCSQDGVAKGVLAFFLYLSGQYDVLKAGPTFPFAAMDWSMPAQGWMFLQSQGDQVDWAAVQAIATVAITPAYAPGAIPVSSFRTPVVPWVNSVLTHPVTSVTSPAPTSWGSTANQVRWSSYNPAIPYSFVPWGSIDWARVTDPFSFQNELLAAFNKLARSLGKEPPFPTVEDRAAYAVAARQYDVLIGAVPSAQGQAAYATALQVLQTRNIPLDEAKKITLPALLVTLGDLAAQYDAVVTQIASAARLAPVENARAFTEKVLNASKPPLPQTAIAAKAFTLPQAQAAFDAQSAALPVPYAPPPIVFDPGFLGPGKTLTPKQIQDLLLALASASGNAAPPHDYGAGGRPGPVNTGNNGRPVTPLESAASLACRKQGLQISPDNRHCLDAAGARAGSDPTAGEQGGGAATPLTAADCTALGKRLSADGLSCVDPAGKKTGPLAPADCTAIGKVLAPDGLSCVDPPKSIVSWIVGGGILLTAGTIFYLTAKGHPAPSAPSPTQHPRRR